MNIKYYKHEIEKTASIGSMVSSVASKVVPIAAKGLKSFGSMSAGKRIATGAAGGAVAKGLTYKPQDGDTNGRIKAMATGAVGGAFMGGAAGKFGVKPSGQSNLQLSAPSLTSGASLGSLQSGPISTGPITNLRPGQN